MSKCQGKRLNIQPDLLHFIWLTFEVQYFWAIVPALETVWVTILPSSGIHGPQIPPCFWKETTKWRMYTWSVYAACLRKHYSLNRWLNKWPTGKIHETDHEAEGTGVDVGMIDTAVQLICVVPVCRAFVVMTEPFCFGCSPVVNNRY